MVHAEHHGRVIAQLRAQREALDAELNVLRVSMKKTDGDAQRGLDVLDVSLKAMHGQIGDLESTVSGLSELLDKVRTACQVIEADLQARTNGGSPLLAEVPCAQSLQKGGLARRPTYPDLMDYSSVASWKQDVDQYYKTLEELGLDPVEDGET